MSDPNDFGGMPDPGFEVREERLRKNEEYLKELNRNMIIELNRNINARIALFPYPHIDI